VGRGPSLRRMTRMETGLSRTSKNTRQSSGFLRKMEIFFPACTRALKGQMTQVWRGPVQKLAFSVGGGTIGNPGYDPQNGGGERGVIPRNKTSPGVFGDAAHSTSTLWQKLYAGRGRALSSPTMGARTRWNCFGGIAAIGRFGSSGNPLNPKPSQVGEEGAGGTEGVLAKNNDFFLRKPETTFFCYRPPRKACSAG